MIYYALFDIIPRQNNGRTKAQQTIAFIILGVWYNIESAEGDSEQQWKCGIRQELWCRVI